MRERTSGGREFEMRKRLRAFVKSFGGRGLFVNLSGVSCLQIELR